MRDEVILKNKNKLKVIVLHIPYFRKNYEKYEYKLVVVYLKGMTIQYFSCRRRSNDLHEVIFYILTAAERTRANTLGINIDCFFFEDNPIKETQAL